MFFHPVSNRDSNCANAAQAHERDQFNHPFAVCIMTQKQPSDKEDDGKQTLRDPS
jgi:hypothetical protein